MQMILKRIQTTVGTVTGTNCYIVMDELTHESIVVDPGAEIEAVINMLMTIDSKLKYIVLTHCHGDHISGVNRLKEVYGGKVLIHKDDEEGLRDGEINLASYINLGEVTVEADSRLNDGDTIHIGNLKFKVIHTPGHTKGGLCLYCEEEKMLFSGDTMFRGSWGRIDLPTRKL